MVLTRQWRDCVLMASDVTRTNTGHWILSAIMDTSTRSIDGIAIQGQGKLIPCLSFVCYNLDMNTLLVDAYIILTCHV